ncbi:MAG: alpha/beta hydrolase family protein [Longimicrobiales bacterium]
MIGTTVARSKHVVSVLVPVLIGLGAHAERADAQGPPETTVLGDVLLHTDAPNSLYRHVAGLAYELLDARERRVATLLTAEAWEDRRAEVRRTLRRIAGGFPPKTPLNARITGTLPGAGFSVEKLVFESSPGFHVTAAVFVPEGITEPRPAVVYASGHAAEGFRSTTYQTAILNLVHKGFVVLAFDPVGQGERRQYDDPETGETRVGGPTREHSYPGAQIFLVGDSPALYFVWDGIRAIDYLSQRPDVDPTRIGVTGRSGGGTQSSYIAAFDERVRAVAPENYLTSFRRLFETRGPQDAEQNLFGGIEAGIDHGDLILAHAPKPYLLIATTLDMFSIQGVRETATEARRAYDALGASEAFRVVEDDAGHASTRLNREAMYAFFQDALELPGSSVETEVTTFAVEDLFATKTGQVATSLGGEDLFTLNRARATRLVDRLEERRGLPGHLDEVRREAAERSGIEPPTDPVTSVFYGRFIVPGPEAGYTIEHHSVEGEGGYPIPLMVLVPPGDGPHPAVLYVHGDGKAVDAHSGGQMELLVRSGFVVVAPDMVGTGEVGPGDFRGDAFDFAMGVGAYNVWWGANQSGRSLVGIRAGDLLRVVGFLRGRQDVQQDRLGAVAVGAAGPVVLHLALVKEQISGLALVGSPTDYASMALNRYYKPELVHGVVPGALRAYDLPDLVAAIAPRPVLVVDPVDHQGKPVSDDQTPQPGNDTRRVLVDWLEGVLRGGR